MMNVKKNDELSPLKGEQFFFTENTRKIFNSHGKKCNDRNYKSTGPRKIQCYKK